MIRVDEYAPDERYRRTATAPPSSARRLDPGLEIWRTTSAAPRRHARPGRPRQLLTDVPGLSRADAERLFVAASSRTCRPDRARAGAEALRPARSAHPAGVAPGSAESRAQRRSLAAVEPEGRARRRATDRLSRRRVLGERAPPSSPASARRRPSMSSFVVAIHCRIYQRGLASSAARLASDPPPYDALCGCGTGSHRHRGSRRRRAGCSPQRPGRESPRSRTRSDRGAHDKV